MAHFAELDNNNNVIRVIVVHNNELIDGGIESENKGIIFCQKLYGANTSWKQTSYNGNMRKNFAGIGFKYDPTLDAFISPQPYPSWVLNETTCQWLPPIPAPNDGKSYSWDEQTKSWKII